jgi:CDP-glucose 4,6-dehydratase
VLKPLRGYLLYAESLVVRPVDVPRALNFGPADRQAVSVRDLVAYGGQVWNSRDRTVPVPDRQSADEPRFAETPTLLLDSRLARDSLDWASILTWQEAAEMTLTWHLRNQSGSHAADLVATQLDAYRTLVMERNQ